MNFYSWRLETAFVVICFGFLSCFPLFCCEGPFLPTCPSVLSHCPVLLTCAKCSNLAVLSLTSWPYFHVLTVLSILACIYRPVTILWCPYRPFPTVLSLSSWPAVLTLPSYPVLTLLSWLYHSYPTVLSLPPCPYRLVSSVLSLSPDLAVLTFRLIPYVLTLPSWHKHNHPYPTVLALSSCP